MKKPPLRWAIKTSLRASALVSSPLWGENNVYVCILLIHSCLQANGMGNFVSGQGKLSKVWTGKGMPTICPPPPPRANDICYLHHEGWASTTGECCGDQLLPLSDYSWPWDLFVLFESDSDYFFKSFYWYPRLSLSILSGKFTSFKIKLILGHWNFSMVCTPQFSPELFLSHWSPWIPL